MVVLLTGEIKSAASEKKKNSRIPWISTRPWSM
jgi:hypothetical protein